MRRHQPAFDMKKKASTERKPTLPKKSGGVRAVAGHHAGSSARSDRESCIPLEVTPPPTLPFLMSAPRGTTLRRVRFGYFKPEAREVHVVGSFNGWNPAATPMRRDALGDWSIEIELPPGEHRYRFLVDGEWHDDPAAQQTALNPFGGFDAIVVVV